MTSFRQMEANRRNAFKSTGPTTDAGKQRSRGNAVRHGLTAETVIRDLEDAEDYQAFELSVTSGFDAPTAVERELVLRLASLLWRLRRATAINTGLLELQSRIIDDREGPPDIRVGASGAPSGEKDALSDRVPSIQAACATEASQSQSPGTVHHIGRRDLEAEDEPPRYNSHIARCFLRLANLDNGAFDRAIRYETALWRQVGQILLTLDFIQRTRPPHGH
jgi:hypothetical protein